MSRARFMAGNWCGWEPGRDGFVVSSGLNESLNHEGWKVGRLESRKVSSFPHSRFPTYNANLKPNT